MQHSRTASETKCFDIFANKRKFQSISDTLLRPQFYEKGFQSNHIWVVAMCILRPFFLRLIKRINCSSVFHTFNNSLGRFFNLAWYLIELCIIQYEASFMTQIWWHVCCCAILRWSRQMTLEDKLCLWPAKNLEIYIQISLSEVIDTFHFLFSAS